MSNRYLDFPSDLFNQLGTNEKLTREVNYSHGVCNSESQFLHYCTMYEGKSYKTSQEQKNEASKLFALNVQKAIENIGNKLVFVGMGMSYASRYEGDVCNHRIRTEITNPEGKKFFIELGTWGAEKMRVDFVIDRDQEVYYRDKLNKSIDKINANGGFYKIPQSSPLYLDYKKYQAQPFYHFKKELYKDYNGKYTMQNVIELVNELFDCNFVDIEIDYNHLTTELYSSISPKK